MGLLRPWSGSVIFDGKDVSRLPAYTKADMGSASQRARPNAARNLKRVYAWFPRLKERTAQKAGTLSSGEQQMPAVARGIIADPIILFIDELSLGLAPVLVLTLFDSLKQLREHGITIVLVEQNVQVALAISDYGYVIVESKVELEGPARQLIKDKHVREAYLGL